MAQQTLNDGVSFGEQRSKINSNFTELYSTKTNMSDITTAVSAHVAASDPHGVTYPITPGGCTVDITGTDLNSAYRTGFYRGELLVNAPLGNSGWWHVLIQSHSAVWLKQTATSFGFGNTVGDIYERVCAAGAWTTWAKVYKEGDAIGVTAQNSGAFTSLSASGSIFTSSGIDINSPAGGTWSNYAAADGSLRWYKAGDKLQLSSIGLALDGSLSTTQGATLGGNVGIGVTPSAWSSYKSIQFGYSGALSNHIGLNYLRLESNSFNGGSGETYLQNGHATKYAQNSGAGVHAWYTAPSGTAGQPISFTQAMALDASGNLLVGTTNFASSNTNSILIGAAYGAGFWQHISGTAPGATYHQFNYNGSPIGSITQNGTTSVAFNTTSDHRLKENIRPANAGRFNDIKFVDFEWIDGRHDCGVIAHQLQEIYPDLVIGEKDATEVRKVEITPAVPAVTEQQLVSEAIFNEDGEEVEPAVYETIEITPAVEAVFEDQEFPVYQQVNYIGLIGRMGTRIQMLDKLATEQAEVISKLEARLSAIEAKLN